MPTVKPLPMMTYYELCDDLLRTKRIRARALCEETKRDADERIGAIEAEIEFRTKKPRRTYLWGRRA